MLEVYNECIRDLLTYDNNKLDVHYDNKHRVVINKLTNVEVKS